MANYLVDESSPYLLQHAGNPVSWYPWSEEALERARTEDKPIFLSIGYSACHWCHVMAHESFEDERVAAVLNEHFVSIKVDREERPDLDRIYMSAVQAMTGSGGWPMSVFCTADGKPFHGGTYYPPTARHGLPSFTDLLLAVVQAWRTRRAELVAGSERVVAAIETQSAVSAADETDLDPEVLTAAVGALGQRTDRTRGGWGSAPKFPQPMAIEFLLRYHSRTGEDEALRMACQALDAMARGGLYDQIGGGFHRYAVDERWLVPHFEKMTYDSAQLARVYLHAWQVTGTPFYRTIVEETLDYVVREMADPLGGFYSTQDADSEGEEGKFFVWTPDEIREVLGEDAAAFMAAYGVTERGNFPLDRDLREGKSILELVGSLEQRQALAEARHRLFEVREQRVHPGRDDKVLTSWNGLMLAAFAEAARVLDRQDYHKVAERSADFLLRELSQADGRMLHSWKDGVAKLNGYLEDTTHLVDGLIELYQTSFDPRWYRAAEGLVEQMIAHFGAETGFYDTSDDHETLVTRPRELQDNAVPSGNAMAAGVLLRMGGLGVKPEYTQRAREMLLPMQEMLSRHPLGFGQWLAAFEQATSTPYAVALVGALEASDTQALLEVYRTGYRPHHVVAAGEPGEAPVPLLQYREAPSGHATAYVCIGTVCRPPVTDPAALRDLLAPL